MKKVKNQYEQKLTQKEGALVYAKLRRDVTEAGILKRDYLFYFFLSLFAFGGFFLSIYCFFITHSPLYILLSGFSITFFTVQIGGLLHDGVHRAIFNSAKLNDAYGFICGAATGIIYNSWKEKHNLHHAHPNQEEKDPDIEIPFLALNTNRYQDKNKVERLATPYQAYLKSNFKNSYIWQIGLLALGIFFWFLLPFFAFSLPKAIFFFLFVNGSLGVYLANIFAPNHKGMPQITKNQKLSFLEQQIVTSRNVKPGFITDVVILGLNYQIEHHLFPECPRSKLKLLTPFVKKMCQDLCLEYTEVSLVKSNKIILSGLNQVAASVG